jgi:ribonucleoside-diphosphate reductase alpha chain
MSDMLKHLVMFYKYGGKQLYYFNTYDGSGEIDIERLSRKSILIESVIPTTNDEIDDCDSCKI